MGYLGAFVGPVVLGLLTVLFHGIFFPELLGDGLYVLVFVFLAPMGMLLGETGGTIRGRRQH